jgi:hypothetical protein
MAKSYCADTDAHVIHAPSCPKMPNNAHYVQIRSKLALESFLVLGFQEHECMDNANLADLPDVEEYPYPNVIP